MATILVLEDSPERTRWLLDEYLCDGRRIGFRLICTASVETFCDEYDHLGKDIVAVVLDHDLGIVPPRGRGPANGNDAADHMVRRHAEHGLQLPPVLVWSINPVGGPSIVRSFHRAGHSYPHVVLAPFGIAQGRIRSFLDDVVRRVRVEMGESD